MTISELWAAYRTLRAENEALKRELERLKRENELPTGYHASRLERLRALLVDAGRIGD